MRQLPLAHLPREASQIELQKNYRRQELHSTTSANRILPRISILTMATDEIRKKDKKEKKDKKRKSEDIEDGAAEPTPKKSKKEKRKSEVAVIETQDDSVMDVDAKAEDDKEKGSKAVIAVPLAALVPFANPLADDKSQKKVLKAVKKGKNILPWSPLRVQWNMY